MLGGRIWRGRRLRIRRFKGGVEGERLGERLGNGERENLKRKRAESPIAEGSGEGERLNEKTTNGEALNRNRVEDPMAEVSIGERSTGGRSSMRR